MNVNSSLSIQSSALGPTPVASGRGVRPGFDDKPVEPAVADATDDAVVESIRNVRLAAHFDKPTGRIVTRVIDRSDGEVIQQIPDDDALRVLVGIREMVGLVVDETV